jgi:hypothetical protein
MLFTAGNEALGVTPRFPDDHKLCHMTAIRLGRVETENVGRWEMFFKLCDILIGFINQIRFPGSYSRKFCACPIIISSHYRYFGNFRREIQILFLEIKEEF